MHAPVAMLSPSQRKDGICQGTNLPSYKLLFSGFFGTPRRKATDPKNVDEHGINLTVPGQSLYRDSFLCDSLET